MRLFAGIAFISARVGSWRDGPYSGAGAEVLDTRGDNDLALREAFKDVDAQRPRFTQGHRARANGLRFSDAARVATTVAFMPGKT